jgi:CheY-like chemotaxis protein
LRRAKTILLVEDNWDNRTIYAEMLRHAGYSVLEAADGIEGLRLACEASPDLILMDLSMPHMDGWEAIARLKDDIRTKNIQVCALSAHVLLEGDWDRVESAGFDCYLTKPIEPREVLHEVQRRIGPPESTP